MMKDGMKLFMISNLVKQCQNQVARTCTTNPIQERVNICFDEPREVYEQKTNEELLRAYFVFNFCRSQFLVKYANTLLDYGKTMVGKQFVNALVGRTFYKHFCSGGSQHEIEERLRQLNSRGSGAILQYGAEDDVNDVSGEEYSKECELQCDRLVNTFSKSIEAAVLQEGQGFAAIKVTALSNPKLLERVSQILASTRLRFSQLSQSDDGFVSLDDLKNQFSNVEKNIQNSSFSDMCDKLPEDPVDFVHFTEHLELSDLSNLLVSSVQFENKSSSDIEVGLTSEELELFEALVQRVGKLAQLASDKKVNLLIDAEHTYFQPAIDYIVVQLQRQYNHQKAVVYNTYQCYLKDSFQRVTQDIERARRANYVFAAKFVRGAYMVLERLRAKEMQYPSPIHDTIDDTHSNYNRIIEKVLNEIKNGRRMEVMVASHNQQSIELAIDLMNKLDLNPRSSKVSFGQLLGMADNLTFTLGRYGYRAYKVVTFGPIDEVIPFLIRRAQENSGFMAGARLELQMIKRELLRRNLSERFHSWTSSAKSYLKKTSSPFANLK